MVTGIPFINVQIAEALEYDYRLIQHDDHYHLYIDNLCEYPKEVDFTSWEGMGYLLQHPKVQDKIQLGIYPTSFGDWVCRSMMPGYENAWTQAASAPLAASLAFLKTQGVEITSMDLT